jgi:hypothetical protein
MWWTPDKGMLQLHRQLPDVMGAQFEATITKLTERMKPAKGQPWDSFEHRAADALHQLCDQPQGEARDETPTLALKPVLHVQVPQSGPAEIAGVPIADELLEQWRANGLVQPVIVDEHGVPIGFATRTTMLSMLSPQDPAGDPVARRALPLRHVRGPLRTPDPPPATPVLGRQRRPLEPRSGVRPRRAPPEAHPPRPLGPGRQPQPARRPPHGPHQRPHPRRSRTIRPPTPTRRTDGGVTGG